MAKMNVNSIAVDAQLESAYGAGPSATTTFASANLLFRTKTPFNVDTEKVDLQELGVSFTKRGSAIGRSLAELSPSFNLQSFAGNPTISRLDTIFRACGLARTSTGSTCNYKFRSTGFESAGLAFFEGAISGNGILHTVRGAYGSLVFAGSAGKEITIEAKMKGLYTAGVSQAAPTITLPANNIATFKSAGCTIIPAAGADFTKIGKEFSLDLGWPINEDKDFQTATALSGLLMGRRNPTMSMTIGLDSVSFLTLQAARDAGTRITTVWTQTDSDGGKTRFTVKSLIDKLTKGEDNEFGTLQIEHTLSAAADDDELLIEQW